MGKTFSIRITRLVSGQTVRTYLDVEADNEVEALLKVVDLMRKATQESATGTARRVER
jgi:hypothetical protein